jgi:hypothetical protein
MTDLLFTVLTGCLAVYSAYQSGKIAAVIDVEQADGRRSETWMTVMWIANLAFAVYFVISLYGQGVARCTQ